MLEVVVALALMAVLAIPVLQMGTRNVELTRFDRVRLEAEALCHDTLERFGRDEDGLQTHLTRSTTDPALFETTDPWNLLDRRYREMGHDQIALLAWRYDLRMRVTLRADLVPGLDLLACEVSWRDDRDGSDRCDRVRYERFIIHDHTH
jgi:hypothetical protein